MLSRFVRELRQERQAARASWDPPGLLTPWQRGLFDDQAEVRIADAGRRTGKTFEFAVEALSLCTQVPDSRVDYAAKSESDARDLIWDDLITLNSRYQLGGVPRSSTIRFPNRSILRVTGAKDPAEAQRRWRGRGRDLIGVDEAQMMPWLEPMVLQAIMPALIRGKRRGRLWIGGTPHTVKGVGFWERVRDGGMPGWSIHRGTVRDNPKVGDVEQFLRDRAAEFGLLGWNHPDFQREYLRNQLPPDENSGLVYRYWKDRNDPAGCSLEVVETAHGRGHRVLGLPTEGRWHYGVGVDLGHTRDASSILVLGVCESAPGKLWLVEEFLFYHRQLNAQLTAEIRPRLDRYRPIVLVCDEGALGVQTADNLRAPPHRLPLVAAEKLHKLASSDSLNTVLLSGAAQFPADSRLADDLTKLRWDQEELQKGRRKMARDPHSDLEPPARYLLPVMAPLLEKFKPPVKQPPRTVEQAEREEDERERRAAQQAQTASWWKAREQEARLGVAARRAWAARPSVLRRR